MESAHSSDANQLRKEFGIFLYLKAIVGIMSIFREATIPLPRLA